MIPGIVARSGVVGTDPNFANVVLLCGFNGANGATSFTSEDSAARTATFVSTAALSTAQQKFGGASLAVNGSSDYVTFPDSADFFFGTNNFTFEAWVRFSNYAASQFQGVVAQWGNAADRAWAFYAGANLLSFYYGSGLGFANVCSLANGVWYHVAACRSTNDLRFFLNGVQQGATRDMTGISLSNQTSTIKVGRSSTSEYFGGHIDEVRVTRAARYTGNFTPPGTAFPRS